MNLVIDVGNTQYKLCVFAEGDMVFHEYYNELNHNLIQQLLKDFPINKAIFSDTRGGQKELLAEIIPESIPLLELSHNTKIPITLDYETPHTLGKDRIAGAVGANYLFPNNPVLVIDIGTAITIDIVTADANFKGGIISPGPEMRFKALHHFTGKLPLEQASEKIDLYGKRTSTAIQYGVQNGVLYELNGYIQQYHEQFDELKVIITGGHSYLFDKKIKYPIFAKPYLIPLGLNRILNYNE